MRLLKNANILSARNTVLLLAAFDVKLNWRMRRAKNGLHDVLIAPHTRTIEISCGMHRTSLEPGLATEFLFLRAVFQLAACHTAFPKNFFSNTLYDTSLCFTRSIGCSNRLAARGCSWRPEVRRMFLKQMSQTHSYQVDRLACAK